jgi:uncharacterized protein YjbI with pentapeptide repeats
MLIPLLIIAILSIAATVALKIWVQIKVEQTTRILGELLRPASEMARMVMERLLGPEAMSAQSSGVATDAMKLTRAVVQWSIGMSSLAGVIGILIATMTLAISFTVFLATVRQSDIAQVQAQEAVASRIAQRFYPLYGEFVQNLEVLANKAQAKADNSGYDTISLDVGAKSKLVALSQMARPYRFLEDDGKLTDTPLSPERGVLLMTLVQFRVHEMSLSRADFTSADLRGEKIRFSEIRPAQLEYVKLYRANLSGADLTGANLSGAKLIGANLRGADLSEAQLWQAELRGADLTGANLSNANLEAAKFEGANLSGVSLRDASLTGASFAGATFEDADFAGAKLVETKVEDVDLSRVKGLTQEQLKHADGTTQTRLPAGLKRPSDWAQHEKWYREVEKGSKELTTP